MTAIDPQAAVDEVRSWVNSARYDEELIELEAQTLRAVLEALDTARAAVPTAEYRITALVDPVEIDRPWVAVQHEPCGLFLFGNDPDDPDDPDDTDAAQLLERLAGHRCEPCPCGCRFTEPCGCGLEDCECVGSCPVCDTDAEANRSNQIIDVDVDGEQVTAAIHGSRPMNAEEQKAAQDIIRAAARHHREQLREEKRQRDEDVRAVAALLKLGDVSFHGTWLTDWDDARTTLSLRFANRIAELQERDVAYFEADFARRDAHMSGETPIDGTKP